MTDGPLLWYLNRSTGFVILGLLTVTTVLGLIAAGDRTGRGVPRFVTQALHRHLAVLSLALLVAHVATAVADEFVDIRWWHAFVPWGAAYEPVWLGLGTLALDALIVVSVTSALRGRLSRRGWKTVHHLAYVAWALSVGHTLGIGTDVGENRPWAIAAVVACLALVGTAATVRLARLVRDRGRRELTGVGA